MDSPPVIVHAPSRDVSAIVVCVAAGSRFEPPAGNGLAHLLEHAVFLSAGQRDYRSIRGTIDALGGDVSAETGEELILYWGSVREARDFSECVELLADLVLAPRFNDDLLGREVGAVVQEINGAGDDVFQVVVEKAKRLIWPRAPLGRPVGGSEKVLRSLDASSCERYWRETHRGDRMLILVVGSAVESRIARARFSARSLAGASTSVSAGISGPKRKAANGARPRSEPRFRAAAMAGRFARLCLGLPGLAWTDPRLPALTLVNDILGRDETSRLWERVRGQGLSYTTESFLDCFSDSGWLGILSDAPVDATGEVVSIVCREIAGLAHDLGGEELEEARKSHVARLRNDEQNAPIEWAKFQALQSYYTGHVPSVDDVVREIEAVTLAQAREVAEELLRPGRMHLAIGGPRRSLESARAAFQAFLGQSHADGTTS